MQSVTYTWCSPISRGGYKHISRLILLGVEEQKLAIFLANVLYIDFGPGGKGYVHTITLPQLDGVTTDVDLDCSAVRSAGIVTGPLNEMGVDISARSSMGEGSGGREDGGKDVKWGVNGSRARCFALIDNRLAVLHSRRNNVRPFVPFFIIGEMSK